MAKNPLLGVTQPRLLFRYWHRRARRRLGGERGFTLLEMLIAAFLAAFAAGLIGTALNQFFIVTQDGNARMAVLSDLQNASLWLGRDASESQSFTLGSGTEYGTLTTGDPNVKYRYSYDAGNTTLVREHLVSGLPQSTQRVARRIASQSDATFSVSGSLLTVSITATSAGGTITEGTSLKLSMRVR